jgi:hypothetical protein
VWSGLIRGCSEAAICVVETQTFVSFEASFLTFKSVAASLCTTKFNIQKFCMVLALPRVFCTDLRTDSDFYFIRHEVIGFYNRGGKCLQRGTD